MKAFGAMLRKELSSFFVGPIAYVTMIVVLFVTGMGFGMQVSLTGTAPVQLDLLIFWLPTLWLMVLIVSTVLTMRLFAEEKRSGTLETLMTAPVNEAEVVLAKYVSALIAFLIIFLPCALHLPILRTLSSGIVNVDRGIVLGGVGAFILIGAFYLSVGLFISALTRSQVVSAITAFSVLCILFILAGTVGHVSYGTGHPILSFASPFRHISLSARGIIDSRVAVFYVSMTVLMLFATVKTVESRRWL
jgi:ABC-2 type transport system permease protein